MSLSSGTRLGPDEVLAPLGAGGMGEVYRAKDTRLGRTVAIKVLPDLLAQNPDLRQRFEREARAVSSLNHPHICVLHDIGHENGTDYLVLEYLEGESLHDRLEKGPLPLDQALRYAIEIADALDKAHRHGVIHRDLKPGNVMLTKSGAKLLDFGLAKKAEPILSGDAGLSALATEAKPLTEKGTLLGTIPYMSPEQIEGREADARTDLWALGCLLYEMVTGKRAFLATSPASLIGAILKDEPRSMRELKPLAPLSLERLVKTCLTKDPDERWQNAHDLAAELRWVGAEGSRDSATAAKASGQERLARLLPWLLAVSATLVAVWAPWARVAPNPGSLAVQHFDVVYPADVEPVPYNSDSSLALSPDGRIVAMVGIRHGARSLFVRRLESPEVLEIADPGGVNGACFSPDAKRLALLAAGGRLLSFSLADGERTIVTANADGLGALAWGEAGIVFTRDGGLWFAPDGRGEPRPLTTLDASRHEILHTEAHFLPGGRTILFSSLTTEPGAERIEAVSVEGGARREIVEHGRAPLWSSTGHVLFLRAGAVLAMGFDEKAVQVRSAATPVLPAGFVRTLNSGALGLRLAANGTLLYVPREFGVQRLVSVARNGSTLTLGLPHGNYSTPRVSPDGRRVIVGSDLSHLEALNLERGTRAQLTPAVPGTAWCVWNRDGSRIAFRRLSSLLWLSTDGTDRQGEVKGANFLDFPSASGPDPDSLVATRTVPETSGDVYLLSLSGAFTPRPLLATRAYEGGAQFSPDGRWLVYVSNETGQLEIRVRRFPQLDRQWQVSEGGGTQPRWSANGREIYYRGVDSLTAVPFDGRGSEPVLGKPLLLFRDEYDRGQGITIANYDVTPEGRFLMLRRDPQGGHLRIVLNWTEELKRTLAKSSAP